MARARVDLNTWLILGAIALGYYLFTRASRALAPAANVVADTIFALTSPSAVTALGRVKLPTGETIAINDIVTAGGRIDGRGFFTWRNVGYQITGREDSVYVARRIVS